MVVVLVGYLMTVRNYCSAASEVYYSMFDSVVVVVVVGEAVDATVAVAAVVVVVAVVFAVAVVELPSVA